MAQLFTEWINLLLELNWHSLFPLLTFKFSIIQVSNSRQRDGKAEIERGREAVRCERDIFLQLS